MSIAETRRDQVFPVLDHNQIEVARRFASGPARRFSPGETMFAMGEANAPAWLVLEGECAVSQRDARGEERTIIHHGAGEFTGEISQLAGRAAIAEGHAGAGGCLALPFDAAHLRALVVGSAELGELVMRAFILRRVSLITEGGAGAILLGHPTDPDLVRLQGFLTRNGFPHTVLDTEADADAATLVERFGLSEADLPVALTPDGTVLRQPTDAALAARLGITPRLDPEKLFDVAVIGAGPAGLATAVYAASEGLEVIVLDSRAIGGQAGASARIENYLGFPTGITGQALAGRAFTQAEKFGATIAVPVEIAGLDCGGGTRRPGDSLVLMLTDGGSVKARAVVIASGARYRRPDIPNLATFDGAGVSYWASPVEAKLCAGEEVALVGAGNSAGQAVAYLAPKVSKLRLIVRGDGLEASMSRYLIERIAALPNVEIETRTEIVALDGDRRTGLRQATFRDRRTGVETVRDLRHLFLFIGADPNTDWLSSCAAAVDPKGFVLTGGEWDAAPWPAFKRRAAPLETSIPGVFAIGDVRSGSTKRVAAAVGDGAAVVAQLHAALG